MPAATGVARARFESQEDASLYTAFLVDEVASPASDDEERRADYRSATRIAIG
jgi:hypothetical protein